MNPVCTAGWQQCEVLPWNINKTVDNQERGTDVTWPRPGPACIITRSTLTPPVISSQSCVSVYLLSICKHIYLQCIPASISPVFAPRHDADFMWARLSPAGVGSPVVALGNKELTVSCMHSAPPATLKATLQRCVQVAGAAGRTPSIARLQEVKMS